MFNINQNTVATVNANYLPGGIHTVTFNKIEMSVESYGTVLDLHFSSDAGSHRERMFAPKSSERQQMAWGAVPSETEQFISTINQVLGALVPEYFNKIKSGEESLSANSFEELCKKLIAILTPAIGVETQIKLIPTTGSYVGFPRTARLKDDVLSISTKVIGNGLVLTSNELSKINGANTAKPTEMKSEDYVDTSDDLGTSIDFDKAANDIDESDDLPF